jgi:hypothetical protein
MDSAERECLEAADFAGVPHPEVAAWTCLTALVAGGVLLACIVGVIVGRVM